MVVTWIITNLLFSTLQRCSTQFQCSYFVLNTSLGLASPKDSQCKSNQPLRMDGKVDLSHLNIVAPLLDRFDLRFILRKPKGERANREYAMKKAELELEDKEIADNSYFLAKYIEYSKRFNPELTDNAKFLLVEYHTNATVAAENDKTNSPNTEFESLRSIESLFNITRAIARLKFKAVAEADDAMEAIEFFNSVSQDYRESATIPTDPRDLAVSVILESIKEFASHDSKGVGIKELCRIACKKDAQVSIYLGEKWSIDVNKKVKKVFEIVRVNKHVETVNLNPLLLRWREYDKDSSDLSDQSDETKTAGEQNSTNREEQQVRDEKDQAPCISAKPYGSDESDREKSTAEELLGEVQVTVVLG